MAETDFGNKTKLEEYETLVKDIREGFLLFYVSTMKTSGDFWERKDGEFRVDREQLIESVQADYKYLNHVS